MAGYVYRGTQFDVPDAPATPAASKPTRSRGFDPDACGTMRGYKQHLRHREEACRNCKDACAENMAERRRVAAERGYHSAFKPEKCGTIAGHSQHRNMGSPICDKCRQANIDYCKARRDRKKAA